MIYIRFNASGVEYEETEVSLPPTLLSILLIALSLVASCSFAFVFAQLKSECYFCCSSFSLSC